MLVTCSVIEPDTNHISSFLLAALDSRSTPSQRNSLSLHLLICVSHQCFTLKAHSIPGLCDLLRSHTHTLRPGPHSGGPEGSTNTLGQGPSAVMPDPILYRFLQLTHLHLNVPFAWHVPHIFWLDDPHLQLRVWHTPHALRQRTPLCQHSHPWCALVQLCSIQ